MRAEIDEAMERARSGGRGVSVFRPPEAAAFLGVSRRVLDNECRAWIVTRGRRGLAHFLCGKGVLIRREALDIWMQAKERSQMIGA